MGKWVDGVWVPGLPQDAVHELLLITSRTASPDPEPLAYIHAKPLSDSQPWETYSR